MQEYPQKKNFTRYNMKTAKERVLDTLKNFKHDTYYNGEVVLAIRTEGFAIKYPKIRVPILHSIRNVEPEKNGVFKMETTSANIAMETTFAVTSLNEPVIDGIPYHAQDYYKLRNL